MQVLEGLMPRSGRSVETGQGGVQLGVGSSGRHGNGVLMRIRENVQGRSSPQLVEG